jgi:outer membrane protease
VRIIYGFFLFVSIFGAVSVTSLCAAEPKKFPYTFAVGASTGFLYGEGEELVYWDDTAIADNASQLLWDIKPMVYVGSSLYFDRVDPMKKWGVFSTLDLKFGLPGIKTGTMEDRDWDTNNTLVGFSSHDNATEGALLLDFSFGVSFPIQNIIYIRTYFVVSYTHLKWAARDGYGQYLIDEDTGIPYPSVDAAPEKSVYGPAINYSQDWFEVAVGASVYYPFKKYFTLGLSVQFAPLITWTHGRDDHFRRDIEFDDYMSKGVGFKPRGEFTFSPASRLSISFFTGGIFMFETSGPSYTRYAGIDGTLTSDSLPVTGEFLPSSLDAGAAFRAMDMGLLLKITF